MQEPELSVVISVAESFTTLPGGRYAADGPDSGEEYRERFLIPAVNGMLQDKPGVELILDLDGTRYGYPVGWLEEVLGGLRRAVGAETAERLKLRSSDAELLAEANGMLRGTDTVAEHPGLSGAKG